MSGIMVVAEHRHGALRDVTLEMLTAGREYAAAAGEELSSVLLGSDCEPLARSLTDSAAKVVYVNHPSLKEFNYEVYQRALVKLIGEREPSLVLMAHSAFGTDLAPSLAVELGVGVVSDAIGWSRVDAGLQVTRGMYGGKLNADRLVTTTPAVLMVRQSNFKVEASDAKGELETWDPGDIEAGTRTRFISLEEMPTTGIDITKADVIVAIGRGVKEEKNLVPVREFAESIGAVLAGSRPVIDAGWLPKETQVGSSGKTVKPRLYIALGISGAFQHVAGMTGSETIIAVNKDHHAPIFAVAHYGVVDDLHKVIPILKEKLTAAAS